MQMKWRHKQFMHPAQRILTGQMYKQFIHVGSDPRIRCQKADVGIQARRSGVVIASGKVSVAPKALAFTARDEQHLGVGLETDHAIHHLHTDGFKLFSPIDVGFLIKTCLELHHRCHFLATANGFAQQVQHHRVTACSIDGLFDGQHIRVIDRFTQERQDTLKTFERLVNQNIFLAQMRHHRGHTM